MNTLRSRRVAGGFGILALTMLVACVGVAVDGGGEVGYVGGYYEPYGYEYGGWGRDYHVGPARGGERGNDRGGARGGEHGGGPTHAPAYRPAPAGRSAPSIPGRSRGH
jgi:hypothetical protein